MMESTLISTPIGGGSSTIKTFYSVKSSQDSGITRNDWINESSVRQLDSLLHDLKNEREVSNESALFDNNNKSNIQISEYNTSTGGSAYLYPSAANRSSKYVYSKKEHIITDGTKNYDLNDSMLSNKETVYDVEHNDDYKLSDNESILYSVTTPKATSNSSNLELERSSHLSELENLKLSDDILPLPGTKVTTTVRTYTYEVPTDGVIKRDVTITDVHHNSNLNNANIFMNNQKNTFVSSENNSIHSGNKPSSQLLITKYSNVPEPYENIPPVNHLNNIRSTNYSVQQHTVPEPTSNINSTKSYYFKNETITNNSTEDTPKSIEYKVERSTNVGNSRIDNHPQNTMITYKYSKTNSSDEHDGNPIIQPFPVYDQTDTSEENTQPKHLTELLTSFNSSKTTNTHNHMLNNYNPKHEIDTSVAKGNGDNKVVVPSKNLAGPPVYYPPNHEITLRREEYGAASRGGGGWAKARGDYEYESGSKSKSSSKAGGAVVPVCLPLCCAMPCTIM